jgi:uncharacterized protein YbjT (DUF2867 family)
VDILSADVLDVTALTQALKGCSAAYYLVHSMNPSHKDFALADRTGAVNMRDACEQLQLKQIIYLGGLGEEQPDLSHHLRSRAEVGHILQGGKTPVTILRAAMIIGSGSASFEILRYLVDRLPAMITPLWVDTLSQPIAIRNVLEYLTSILLNPKALNQTFDIGGTEVLTYRELMMTYAEVAGLPKRFILPIPVFSPKLSAYWIHIVTPVPAYIAQPLAEGLKNPVLCQENAIRDLVPQPLITCREAISLALERLSSHNIQTHWTDAGRMPPPETVYPDDPNWSGGTVYSDKRRVVVEGLPDQVWKNIVSIGGQTGWYYGNILWKIRGMMDLLVGLGRVVADETPIH